MKISVNLLIKKHKKELFMDDNYMKYLSIKADGQKLSTKEEISEQISVFNLSEYEDAVAVVGNSKENIPDWVVLLKILVKKSDNTKLPEIKNKSNRAIIFFNKPGYVLAYSFGYGKSMLDEDLIVQDFGLKVVVNNIDVNKMTSLKRMRLEDNLLRSDQQAVKDIPLEMFAVDTMREVIGSISGRLLNQTFTNRLKGSDSLQFSFNRKIDKINFEEINSYLIREYNKEKYKKNGFEWIDNITVVKEKNVLKSLNKTLVENINDRKVEFQLPEIREEGDLDKISFTEKGDLVHASNASLFAYLISSPIKNAKSLNHREVFIKESKKGNIISKWKLKQCLYTETTYNKTNYIFAIGLWFKINSDYTRKLNSYLAGISQWEENMPLCKPDYKEDDYIHQFNVDKDYLVLHKEKIEGLELCDLLHSSKSLIHVKPWHRSSTLSHLFSQGLVSAEKLKNDFEFKEKCQEKLKELNADFAYFDENSPPRVFTIVYAIIFKKAKNKSDNDFEDVISRLPIFSKVNLQHFLRNLHSMGYNVALKYIMREEIREATTSRKI